MCRVACPAGCQYCTTDPNNGNAVCQFGQCKISYYMKSDRSCAGKLNISLFSIVTNCIYSLQL